MTGLVRDGVCRRRQCATQAHMKPGLFEDLAYRGARPSLAWLELALGPGPVVVAGSVDHGDLQSTAATTPWQGSGGRDHAVINGVRRSPCGVLCGGAWCCSRSSWPAA